MGAISSGFECQNDEVGSSANMKRNDQVKGKENGRGC